MGQTAAECPVEGGETRRWRVEDPTVWEEPRPASMRVHAERFRHREFENIDRAMPLPAARVIGVRVRLASRRLHSPPERPDG